jgi:hypothetical protein
MRYSVPFRVHGPKCSTKAKVVAGGCSVQFEAPTDEDAERALRFVILPGDPRPVMGRRFVGRYAVGNR